ncbi:MAG: outer membrane protein assembly factor BamD, partial [Acidobacteria bacterium]|nr:outer membrane protein assembly factor BamD [Acidobacteriota bacterium]
EYIARAKLSLADSWYAEGGTAALAQAEQEYEDFETFFPNMPEAAEAQLKIANIQYQQMEKPDRDFTHAVRAEQEYRKVILQYPDNPKMVAEAKKRLLQVQEVIAEREFRVGRFYYLRGSYMAAIARLQSVVDRYPLYSKADEALYLTGQSYEAQVGLIHRPEVLAREKKLTEEQRKMAEVTRERYTAAAVANASNAYSKIITRYPAMNRADDARARLAALHQPVPRPTKAALALNKAEEAGRSEQTMRSRVMGMFERHPDTTPAAKQGDPTLTDPNPISASVLTQQANRAAMGGKGNNSLSVQTINVNPGPNQPAPRSDTPGGDGGSISEANTAGGGDAKTASPTQVNQDSAPAAADPNELKPNAGGPDSPGPAAAASDPNELKPDAPADQPAPAPAQVNEIQPGGGAAVSGQAPSSSADGQQLADDKDLASSKHKKKKGLLHKVIPGGS